MEKVFEFSFGLFKREPKVVLPNVLTLIPSGLLSILILHGAGMVGRWLNGRGIQELFTNPTLLFELIRAVLTYVIVAISILIASGLISILLLCLYSDVVRQAYTRKKILLTQAFSTAKSRFLPLLWTYFLELLIIGLIFGGLFGLGLIGGIIGIVVAMIVGIILILLVLIFFYEIPAIVVLENKSGIEAIRRSFSIGRRNFWSLVLIFFIVGIVLNTVIGSLASIPYVGFAVSILAGLFLNAWSSMIPALFYYEYEKKREEA